MAGDNDITLDDVATQIAEEFRAGNQPSLDDFCERYPELAYEIRAVFTTLLQLERARPDTQQRAASDLLRLLSSTEVPPLGDYRILREIGRGGMGVVFEAVQESLQRRVALKVLSPWCLRDPRHLQRFEHEARAAAALHHTNIVPVLGVGEERGLHYLVMQLISGAALDEILAVLGEREALAGPSEMALRIAARLRCSQPTDAKHAGPLPSTPVAVVASPTLRQASYWRHVAALGLQAAEALAYAHRQGVVHRDIKPSNILVDESGNLWIADFGLAKTADSADLTMSGELVGTARYLPPERLQGTIDARGDIYALGATLYELAVLRPPFAETDKAVLLKRIAETEPPRPRAINRAIPRDLETIIGKAMAKRPSDRYSSAGELAADLRNYLNDQPIGARRISPVERLWRACRRRPAVAIPTLAAILLVLVVAIGSSIAAARLQQKNQLALDAQRRAEEAERSRRLELFRVHVASARNASQTGKLGQRLAGLRSVRDALQALAPAQPDGRQAFELTEAAISCLARADLRELQRVNVRGRYDEVDVDPLFQVFLQPARRGTGSDVVSLSNPNDRTVYPGEDGEETDFIGWRTFSRAGRWLLENAFCSRQDDRKRLRVWERSSGRLVVDLASAENINGYAFHPDERHLLIIESQGVVRLLDLETGGLAREFSRRLFAKRPQFSPDGSRLAFLNATHRVEFVEVEELETLATLADVEEASEIAFHDDHTLIVGTSEGDLYEWKVAENRGRFLPGKHFSAIQRIQISPDAGLMASSDSVGTHVRSTREDRTLLELPGAVVRFAPDGKRIAVHDRNDLALYEIIAAPALRVLNDSSAEAAVFSPDGRWLAASGPAGVKLYSGTDLEPAADLGLDYCGPVAFSADGRQLATMGMFSEACRWPIGASVPTEIGPPQALFHQQVPDFFSDRLAPQHHGRHVVYSGDGRLFIADYRRGHVLVSDSAGLPPREFADFLNVARLVVSPDGKWLGGASVISRTVRVWDAQRATIVLDLPDHAAVAFSHDGLWCALRSASEICVFRTSDWQPECRIPLAASRSEFYLPLVFQPQGGLLAVAGHDQRVYLYPPGSTDAVAYLPHPENSTITHLTFSPDGRRLVVVAPPLGILVWDLPQLQGELAALGTPLGGQPRATGAAVANSTDAATSVVVDTTGLIPGRWHRCWVRMAEIEALKGNLPDAVHAVQCALDRAVDASPSEKAELLTLRGVYELQNHDPLAANDSFSAAVRIDPAAEKAIRLLARQLVLGPWEVQDPQCAMSFIARPLVETPGDEELLVYQAIAQIRCDNADEGLQTLAKVEFSDRWKPTVAYVLALAWQDRDRAVAREHFAVAEQLREERHDRLSSAEREELERLRGEIDSRWRREASP
ncbi:MAG: protein kinase [Pirellulales bacterium]|nr:protein kinase [Pirellulales bacterium]